MADLLKAGARKPRINRGGCYTSNNYADNEVTARGVMPSMCYDLTISNSDVSYTARLTEVEMLYTIQEWLTRYNAHQASQRQRAKDTSHAA